MQKYQPTKKTIERRNAFRDMVDRLDGEVKEGKHAQSLGKIKHEMPGLERYSPINQLLIYTQCPHVTEVHGYVEWQSMGFQVRKGEPSIGIRAPVIRKNEDGEGKIVACNRASVWDRSQVDPIRQDQEIDQETAISTQPSVFIENTTITATPGRLALLEKCEPVAEEVLEVLRAARFEGNMLVLPYQLDRNIYKAVNTAIERIGGKWNRKAKGHIFEDDPQALLHLILETGEMPGKNPTAFFATSEGLAVRMAETIRTSARTILEPSAGTGCIARAIRDYCHFQQIEARLDCCEILPKFQAKLQEQGFTVVAGDFLDYEPEQPYDEIRMNSPFALEGSPLAYVDHVLHAWQMLAEGGHLEAIVPGGFSFREDQRMRKLRELVETVGSWEGLPDDSFKVSAGTGVITVLLEMNK
jgi:hypothetical protein